MSESWIKYKIWCATENKYVYWILGENDPIPTTCSSNTAHTVTVNSVDEVERKTDNVVKIQEETINTGGYYQKNTLVLDIPPSTTIHEDIVFPFNISVFEMEFRTIEAMRDDILNLYVSPNTPVGVITTNVSASGNGKVLNVNSTVVQNIKKGFMVDLFNGTTTEALGIVTHVDPVAHQITVEKEPTNAFSAFSTYVRLTLNPVKTFVVGYPGNETIGNDRAGGTGIPAGTTIRAEYTNLSTTDTKRFYGRFSIAY